MFGRDMRLLHELRDAGGATALAGRVEDLEGTTAATLAVGSGNSAIRFTANEEGAAGNAITITYVDPAGNDATLDVDVDNGTDVVISGATDGASALTSTVDDVIAAIAEDDVASGLITAARGTGGNGTGVVAAFAETALSGGA